MPPSLPPPSSSLKAQPSVSSSICTQYTNYSFESGLMANGIKNLAGPFLLTCRLLMLMAGSNAIKIPVSKPSVKVPHNQCRRRFSGLVLKIQVPNCRNPYAEYFDSVTVSRVSELSTIMEMGHLDHPVAAIGSAVQILQSSGFQRCWGLGN